jgi:Flp pilus assembly protein TadD
MKTKHTFDETLYLFSHQVKSPKREQKNNWKYMLLPLILLILLFAFSTMAQTPEVKKAIYYAETERPGKAMAMMEELVKANLSDPSLYYYQALISLKKGDFSKADASFKKGMELDEKDPVNYAGRAQSLMLQKKGAEAKPFLDKAILLTKTKNVEDVKALAAAYLADEHYASEALTLLKKVKSSGTTDSDIDLLLGDAYALQKNAGLAISNYENAAALDAGSAKPLYKIAMIYVLSKTDDIALDYLKKTTSLDPDYAPAFKELGDLHYLMKHGEESVKAYERYLALTENPELGQMRYAFALFMTKDFSKAIDVFKNVINRKEGGNVALRYYGFSLFEAGDTQSAKTIFENYFSKAQPKEIEAIDYTYFGKTLLKLNEDSLAAMNFEKSLNLEKGQTSVVQLLAETQFKMKHYEKSITSYRELMKLRKKPMAQDYYSIGRAQYFTRHYESADSAFVRLTELQPNLAVGYLWLARAKSNLDPESEQGLAKPFYDKYIEMASATPDKSKNELIEAYSYLGYYYFLKNDKVQSKACWQKVIGFNPKDEKAIEALKAIN